MKRAAIGIDLGGTNLKVALVDETGAIISKAAAPCDVSAGPDTVVQHMAELAATLIEESGFDRSALVGAGLGTPGPLNLTAGTIIRSANLPGWADVPIRDSLRTKLDLPVAIDNDANAAAFGEFWAGAGRDTRDMVMLTLGTGVGAGVILNGELLHGHFDNAAELGHMIVELNGLLCNCGQRGCVEQYASASAVARRAQAAIDGGEETSLPKDGLTSQDVEEAARAGDALALRIWQETCAYLATAIVTIQHAFNPAAVVLGGGLAEAGDQLLDPVRREFRARTWKLHDDAPELRLAKLGYDAGVVGAAGLAWKSVL